MIIQLAVFRSPNKANGSNLSRWFVTDLEIFEKGHILRSAFLDFFWPLIHDGNHSSSLEGRKWQWGQIFSHWFIVDLKIFMKKPSNVGYTQGKSSALSWVAQPDWFFTFSLFFLNCVHKTMIQTIGSLQRPVEFEPLTPNDLKIFVKKQTLRPAILDFCGPQNHDPNHWSSLEGWKQLLGTKL